jgi:hypothetical protein
MQYPVTKSPAAPRGEGGAAVGKNARDGSGGPAGGLADQHAVGYQVAAVTVLQGQRAAAGNDPALVQQLLDMGAQGGQVTLFLQGRVLLRRVWRKAKCYDAARFIRDTVDKSVVAQCQAVKPLNGVSRCRKIAMDGAVQEGANASSCAALGWENCR